MLLHHIRSAWRSLVAQPVYSLINIGGLGGALCACLLILMYVVHEYSYDDFQANRDRLFAPVFSQPGSTYRMEGASFETGPKVMDNDPAVEAFTRLDVYTGKTALARPGKESFVPKRVYFADSNFFRLFSFPLEVGNPATALARPYSVVLTRTLAKTLFGKENPMGQPLRYNDNCTLTVTGIAADPPSNTGLRFEALCSMSVLASIPRWQGLFVDVNVQPGNFLTYFLLKDPRMAPHVMQTIERMYRHPMDSLFYFKGYSPALQSLREEHLKGSITGTANRENLITLFLGALMILVLALVNYMSLATARASLRMKEVGVRRTLGAGRRSLAAQFYVESALCVSLAFALGIGLFFSMRPFFLVLINLPIDAAFLHSSRLILAMSVLFAVTVALAGGYPSFVLSALRPAKVLRSRSGAGIRNTLTVLQFTIAILMIICVVVMERQERFQISRDTGLNRDHLLYLPFDKGIGPHRSVFQADLAAIPGVSKTALSIYPLFGTIATTILNDGEFAGRNVTLVTLAADSAFVDVLQIHWLLKPFDANWAHQPGNILLNESALREMGLRGDVRGRILNTGAHDRIAGVVRDFDFAGDFWDDKAMSISIADTANLDEGGFVFVRLEPGTDINRFLSAARAAYRKYPTVYPFSYRFVDEAFASQFDNQNRMMLLLGLFTVLGISIACLGLFGLATFSTLRRTREVGIRKVLGAGVGHLLSLLTREFLYLVGISLLVGTPVAVWLMQRWLQKFSHKVPIDPWWLVAVGLLVMALTALSVGAQALRAARANPVDSLRSE